MKSVRVLRNLMNVGLLLLMSLFLIQCGSGSGSGISEDKKPKIYKIDVSMVQAIDPAFAVPVGISADGKTLYGTVFLSTSDGIVPVNGFRWTRERGTVLFNDVPGYKDYVTLATHASDDSKVIIGIVYDIIGSQFIPWVWKEGMGYRIINTPPEANMPKLNSITSDGKIVLGSYLVGDQDKGNIQLFVWSEERGIVSFDPAGHRFINVVGFANSGRDIIINSYDERFEHRKGITVFRVKDREDWFRLGEGFRQNIVDIIPPPLELVDSSFYATDYSTMPFWLTAYSKDGTVIGGTITRTYRGSNLIHPALWIASELRLVYLSGLGYNGNVTAVSPDGKWVAYASHYAVGNHYTTIWNTSFGRKELYSMLQSADKYYGTNLSEGFPKYTSIITGFTADNSIVFGSCYSESSPIVPMFGFVIDNFDSVVKAL